MCVYTYLMMGVAEVLRILLYQHHCVLPLDNLGSRKTPHLSSSHLLPHYWYFSFANLAPPSTNTPPHFHLNIFPHLITVYLGFKVILCVQSKQKKVEYQQSFIKQLMGFYSAGTSAGLPGWESLSPGAHTAGCVSQSSLFQFGTGKDTESSGNRWRQHVGTTKVRWEWWGLSPRRWSGDVVRRWERN